jgi:hypothetical protein
MKDGGIGNLHRLPLPVGAGKPAKFLRLVAVPADGTAINKNAGQGYNQRLSNDGTATFLAISMDGQSATFSAVRVKPSPSAGKWSTINKNAPQPFIYYGFARQEIY